MSQTIQGVPIKCLMPSPDYIVVQQYDTTETEGGLHLPEVAKVVVQVCKKAGDDVKHIREGDIVILRNGIPIVAVPEVKGPCALVHVDHVAGVIRGHDWRAEAIKAIKRASLVS